MLGRNLDQALTSARGLPPNKSFVRVGHGQGKSDTAYVFLVLAPDVETPWGVYEQVRSALLQAYCGVLLIEVPEVTRVVGIAMAPVGVTPSSEALFFMTREHFSPDDATQARKLQSELNLLVNFRERAIPRAYEGIPRQRRRGHIK